MSLDKFQHAVECLRSSDSLLYDEGYHTLQGDFLRLHLDNVIQLLKDEADLVMRGRLIELLGDSGESRTIPLIQAELANTNHEIKHWALHALDCLATPQAQALAASFRKNYPKVSQ